MTLTIPSQRQQRHGCTRRASIGCVRGIGLVELMIALALGLVVSGAVLTIFLSSRDALRTTENLSRLHDDARVVFEMLARELREAGAMACGSTDNVANVLNNASNAWWSNWSAGPLMGYDGNAVAPRAFGTNVADRVSGTHAILIRRGTENSVLITKHDPQSNSNSPARIQVNTNNHGFSDGDFAIVCDATSAAIFQITESNANNNTIIINTGSGTPGNCTKKLSYPVVCGSASGNDKNFELGYLSRYTSSLWYIGRNADGTRSLYKIENNLKPTEMARGIVDLKTEYLTSDRSTPPTLSENYASPGEVTRWEDVIAVRVTFTHQTQESTGVDKNPITRKTQYIVSIRNREYLP